MNRALLATSLLVSVALAQSPAPPRGDGLANSTLAGGGGASSGAGPSLVGDFFVYANGCPGGGGGLGTALSLNDNASTTQPGSNNNQFAYKAQNLTSAPIMVLGFELWTTSITANPVGLTTELYDEASPGGAPNLTPIRTGTMVVGNKPAWYRTTFTQPFLLQPQAAVFPSFIGNANILHTRTAVGGAIGIHYFHAPTATTWSGPFMTQPMAWRVLAPVGSGARPLIGNTGVPTIGQPFQANLSQARSGMPVTLGLGASNATWNGLALPFDLTVIGMPGCRVHAGLDLTFGAVSDGSANAIMPIAVPNDPALSGLSLFSQWWVVDIGANPLGFVNSDAAEIRIG